MRLDEIRLDKKGDARGNVENPGAPDFPAACTWGDTPDPLRHVQSWINHASEGRLDMGDLDLLQHFTDKAREEVRLGFVPLSLALDMARHRPSGGEGARHGL